MKGKQPLNLPSPATRPPLIPGPMAIHQPFPMPASAPVAIPTSIQLPTRDFETSKEDRDGAKRTQAASGSGNPAVKKTRIEERLNASMCSQKGYLIHFQCTPF